MRFIYATVGVTSVGLGVLGAVLPVLPTTPFILVALYFLSKSNKRLHDYLMSINWIKNHQSMTMTKTKKWTLLLVVDALLIGYMVYFSQLWVTIGLSAVIVIKHIVFHRYVTVT